MDWQLCYATGESPWDLRAMTPPLLALLRGGELTSLGLPEHAEVAIPGCGRGHDLRAWAGAGHRAIGFDIAPNVVAEAKALLRLNRVEGAEVLCRDLLGIGHEFAARFDAVYDYTCYCALPPHLRSAYGREIAAVVKDGGLWIGLAYPLRPRPARPDGAAGPPFLVRREDLVETFARDFEFVVDFEPEDSVPMRAGAERWFIWRRRARA